MINIAEKGTFCWREIQASGETGNQGGNQMVMSNKKARHLQWPCEHLP